MKYKILVTGATGFIGKYLVPKLVCSYDVIIITRDIENAKKLYENTDINILYGDMNNVNSLENALKNINDIDYVVNLVGGGPLTSNNNYYDELYKLNVETLKNLVCAMDSTNISDRIKLFVHISSLAAMGALNPSDIYNEHTTCMPVLPYEIVKYDSEKFLMDIRNDHSFKILILRPPQVYGTESKEIINMISIIKREMFPIFSKGIGSLPLIHVDDFAETIKRIIQNHVVLTDKFNVYLIYGENYKYTEIVDMVRSSCGNGGYLKIPYNIAFVGIKCMEIIFHLFNRIEPINIYRLNSICKNRKIDDTRFRKDFNIEFRHSLQEFINET